MNLSEGAANTDPQTWPEKLRAAAWWFDAFDNLAEHITVEREGDKRLLSDLLDGHDIQDALIALAEEMESKANTQDGSPHFILHIGAGGTNSTMTMSTHFVIKEPVGAVELFHFCQSLIGDPKTQQIDVDQDFRTWRNEIDWDSCYTDGDPFRSNLHAYLVSRLAGWCTERSLSWAWRHDHTGHWFTNLDELTILGDPTTGDPLTHV